MTATIIDELCVRLSIDPAGFKKGQQQQKTSLDEMRRDAQRTQTAIDALRAKATRDAQASAAEEGRITDQITAIKKKSTAQTRGEDQKQIASLNAQLRAKQTASEKQHKQTADQIIEQRKILEARQKGIRDTEKGERDQLDRGRKRTQQTRDESGAVSVLTSRVLGLLAAFTGGMAIKDFVTGTITSAAALGHMAENLGMGAQDLGAFQGAVRRLGGTSEEATASLQKMVDVREAIRAGQMPEGAKILNSLQMTTQDLDDPVEAMLKMADAAERFKKAGQLPQFSYRARQLGYDQNTINLMEEGRVKLKELMEQSRKYALTDDETKKAQRVQRSWENMKDASAKLGYEILFRFAPAMDKATELLTRLADWAQKNQQIVVPLFTGLVVALTALSAISFVKIAAGMLSIGGAATASTGPIGLLIAALAALELKYGSVSKAELAFERGKARIDRFYAQSKADYAAGQLKRHPRDKHWQDEWKYWSNREMEDSDEVVRVSVEIDKLEKELAANTKATGWARIPGGGDAGSDNLAKAQGNLAKASAGYLKRQGVGAYDTVLGNGRFGTPATKLTDMTMGQAVDFGRTVLQPNSKAAGVGRDSRGLLGSSAMGAYQITASTLSGYAARMFGANWRALKFDAAMQDKIAEQIFNDNKRGNLKKTWASLPDSRAGAYANVPWATMRGIIMAGEVGTGRRAGAPVSAAPAPSGDWIDSLRASLPVSPPPAGAISGPPDTDAPSRGVAASRTVPRPAGGPDADEIRASPGYVPRRGIQPDADRDEIRASGSVLGSIAASADKLASAAQALLESSVALRGNQPIALARADKAAGEGTQVPVVAVPPSYDKGLNVGASVSYAHHVVSNDNSQNVQATTNVGAIHVHSADPNRSAQDIDKSFRQRGLAYNAASGLA